jgi:hypothetical protein
VDLNNDGKMDLVSGSYPGEVYFFRRKPNGSFAAPETLKFSDGRPVNVGRASSVSVVDWNGDGKLDLVIGLQDGAVCFVPNTGTKEKPAFGLPVPLKAQGKSIVAQGQLAGPCIADWDLDGKLDLLLGSESGSVVWYRNVGTKEKPELAAPITLIEPAPQPKPGASLDKPTRSGSRTKISVADWNGDGRPDLLVGDFQYGGGTNERVRHGWVWVYLRKGNSQASVEKK